MAPMAATITDVQKYGVILSDCSCKGYLRILIPVSVVCTPINDIILLEHVLKEVSKMVKAPVNPDVMRWARESANLTVDEVTIKLKKSSEVIEAWEKGLDSPSYAQLEKLAYDVYKRPVAVFFFPHPPREDDIKKSFRTIPEAEFDGLPSTLIRQIRKARVKQENLYELCKC